MTRGSPLRDNFLGFLGGTINKKLLSGAKIFLRRGFSLGLYRG